MNDDGESDFVEVAPGHFVKLYGVLLESSCWVGSHWSVKLLWITLLLRADANGFVYSSVPGLAKLAEIPIKHCRKSLEFLAAPDPDSRTKVADGRRIREVPGGWFVINHHKYRELRTPSQLANAERQKRLRERRKKPAKPIAGDFEPAPVEATRISPVTRVTSNAGHAQRQRQSKISRPESTEASLRDSSAAFAESNGGVISKDLVGSARPPSPAEGSKRSPEASADAERADVQASAPELTAAPTARERGHKCPTDFQPDSSHRRLALEHGVDFEDQWQRFRLHHFAKPLPPEQWADELTLWLLRAADFKHRDDARAERSTPDAPDTTAAATAFRPCSEHFSFCEANELDLAFAVRAYRQSKRASALDSVTQERDFMYRLKRWLETGSFDPDGKLPARRRAIEEREHAH